MKYSFIFFCLLYATKIFADSLIVFKSVGNDHATVEFRLEKTKDFAIIGTFIRNDEDAPPKPSDNFEFKGTYREDLNTYDLSFKDAEKSKIEVLIKGSNDLWIIPSTGKVRMNKAPKDLRLYGIKMELQNH